MSEAGDWYRYNVPGVEVSYDIDRCLHVLSSVGRLYNLNVPRPLKWGIHVGSWGVSALMRQEMSTFDNDTLTRLVIAAHEHCVRVAVGPWSHPEYNEPRRARAIRVSYSRDYGTLLPLPQLMEVTLHARHAREGHMFERHPGMERFAAQLVTP